MNRLILIGNGFDLAHNLKTGYKDFINWYWEKWYDTLRSSGKSHEYDELCSFKLRSNQYWNLNLNLFTEYNEDFIKGIRESTDIYEFIEHPLLENITQSIETNGWVDIENEYYHLLTEYTKETFQEEDVKKLNKQLEFLRKKLIEYLKEINSKDKKCYDNIAEKIYAPFNQQDFSLLGVKCLDEHIKTVIQQDETEWEDKLLSYGQKIFHPRFIIKKAEAIKANPNSNYNNDDLYLFMLPDEIMMLSFNYTNTLNGYKEDCSTINYIHGKLEEPESVIFGYGDELDESYNHIKRLNNNELLSNFKSSKYLEADRYRKLLQFIESAPFQVCIMGHSCGNSDRTLLNTIFEHDNCVSIKPYYYEQGDGKDNYLDIIHNISRNFTDMKKMRDRVVNKTYCEPLVRTKGKK